MYGSNGAGTAFDWGEAVGHARAPYASVLASSAALQAGASGVAMGIFGWADPVAGTVSNLYTAGFLFGFVLPVVDAWSWNRAFISCITPALAPLPFPLRFLRPGYGVVLAAMGNFKTRFAQGGQAGSRVWADPATGLPYAQNGGSFVPTPWTLTQSGGCNAVLQISSFAQPQFNLT